MYYLSKSPVTVARRALAAGQASLPCYSHRYSFGYPAPKLLWATGRSLASQKRIVGRCLRVWFTTFATLNRLDSARYGRGGVTAPSTLTATSRCPK